MSQPPADCYDPLPNNSDPLLSLVETIACLQLLHQLWPPPDALGRGGPSAATPVRFGRFTVRRALGVGSFGMVFRADDPTRGPVALKLPRPEILFSEQTPRWFRREHRIASRLAHPGLARVYEAGLVGPISYVASEYCGGGSLADWLRRDGPPPVRVALRFAAEVAEALQYAHDRGVVHRDLKPENILLGPRETAGADGSTRYAPKIADFGLAACLGNWAGDLNAAPDYPRETDQTGAGTPLYMAPEQAAGRPAQPAADLYPLGVILYELATGRLPFRRPDAGRRIPSGAVPPSAINPNVPREVDRICLMCLAADPDQRLWSAREVASRLRRLFGSLA